MSANGICMVLSAPSGGGKTTLIRSLMSRNANLRHSISYTTRQPRCDQTDLEDYHFISDGDFVSMIGRGEFLEWAEVHGKKYGTSRCDLLALLRQGFDVILDIDIQGALQLKVLYPDFVFVFVMPPSLSILEERLRGRKSESETHLIRRLENARREMKAFLEYDYVVINDDLEKAIRQVEAIFVAERIKVERQDVGKLIEG